MSFPFSRPGAVQTLVAALLALACATPALALPPGAVAEGEVVVRLLPNGDIEEINDLFGTEVLSSIPQELTFLLQLPGNLTEEVLLPLLEALPIVQWAELNQYLQTMDGTTGSFFVSVTGDDYFEQYAFDVVGAEPAPSHAPVVVAMLDTGIDASHPALAGAIVPGGYDFVDGDADPADLANGVDDDEDGVADELAGHGTHLSGLVRLMAPDAGILPIRVLNDDGSGYAFQVAAGIHHAIDQGAAVINMSFGSTVDTEVVANALERASQSGVFVTAAAGNLDQEDPVQYPAGDPLTVAVAATDALDLKAFFSNYGEHVTISAPGHGITGPLPGNSYGQADGSSFSSALVSGGAALLIGRQPWLSPMQVRQKLVESAASIDALNPEYAGLLGAGRLDVAAALAMTPGPKRRPVRVQGGGSTTDVGVGSP